VSPAFGVVSIDLRQNGFHFFFAERAHGLGLCASSRKAVNNSFRPAQRNAFHHRGARQQSRSFARWNQSLMIQPIAAPPSERLQI
jgi:hypothetical protein